MRARGEGPRRHPESPADPRLPPAAPPAAHLRSPPARLQPPHGEYPRSRARSPGAGRRSASFVDFSFRLCGCCFLSYQTTPQPRCHRCPPPASLPSPGSPLQPQEVARGSPCHPDRCSLSPCAALRWCFLLWPSKCCFVPRVPHFSGLQGQKPFGEAPWGLRTPSFRWTLLAQGVLFTVCGPGTFAQKTQKPSSFPQLRVPLATSAACLKADPGTPGSPC